MHKQLIPLLLVAALISSCNPGGSSAPLETTATPDGLAGTIESSTLSAAVEPTAMIITLDPTPVPTYDPLNPDSWVYLPVIPSSISESMQKVYSRGQNSGMNAGAFSKVGDCETYTPYFLSPFDWKESGYRLGQYASLEKVIKVFEGSFARQSLAAKQGFSVASVLSPVWADPEQCNAGDSPIECEYRNHKPAFALIMFGTNDVASSREVFEANLRHVVELTLDYNIVPILATKADNLEADGSINAIIARIAYEYEVPLWNYWRALQHLPDGGLQADQTHLTYAQPFFDYPENMLKGWPWRNLTALQMLEKVQADID